jgi:hypothetical protein
MDNSPPRTTLLHGQLAPIDNSPHGLLAPWTTGPIDNLPYENSPHDKSPMYSSHQWTTLLCGQLAIWTIFSPQLAHGQLRGAKCPVGKCPWGKMSTGRNGHRANCHGTSFPLGELSVGRVAMGRVVGWSGLEKCEHVITVLLTSSKLYFILNLRYGSRTHFRIRISR